MCPEADIGLGSADVIGKAGFSQDFLPLKSTLLNFTLPLRARVGVVALVRRHTCKVLRILGR